MPGRRGQCRRGGEAPHPGPRGPESRRRLHTALGTATQSGRPHRKARARARPTARSSEWPALWTALSLPPPSQQAPGSPCAPAPTPVGFTRGQLRPLPRSQGPEALPPLFGHVLKRRNPLGKGLGLCPARASPAALTGHHRARSPARRPPLLEAGLCALPSSRLPSLLSLYSGSDYVPPPSLPQDMFRSKAQVPGISRSQR